ncbi:MAG: hypothetical protein ACRET2_15110 [Steroidobacteraceae bacterium]
MGASVEDTVLPMLRAIQAEQVAARERDREMITRLANIESAMATLRRETADLYAEVVTLNKRADRIHERLERIERRLDIVEAD